MDFWLARLEMRPAAHQYTKKNLTFLFIVVFIIVTQPMRIGFIFLLIYIQSSNWIHSPLSARCVFLHLHDLVQSVTYSLEMNAANILSSKGNVPSFSISQILSNKFFLHLNKGSKFSQLCHRCLLKFLWFSMAFNVFCFVFCMEIFDRTFVDRCLQCYLNKWSGVFSWKRVLCMQ